MEASQPIKLKLTGRLTQVKEAASAAAAPPPVAAKPAPALAPAPPVLDLQALRSDLSDLARRAQEIHAGQKAAASEAARLSIELGVAIAERLLGVEIAADRQRLDHIVIGVLDKMPATRSVAVRGHPMDLALLQLQLAGHADWPSHQELLRFRPDETCQRGRFKIDADEWFVEWDTQRSLAELRTALLEETFAE